MNIKSTSFLFKFLDTFGSVYDIDNICTLGWKIVKSLFWVYILSFVAVSIAYCGMLVFTLEYSSLMVIEMLQVTIGALFFIVVAYCFYIAGAVGLIHLISKTVSKIRNSAFAQKVCIDVNIDRG